MTTTVLTFFKLLKLPCSCKMSAGITQLLSQTAHFEGLICNVVKFRMVYMGLERSDTAHFKQNNRHSLWMNMTCVSSLGVTAILLLDTDPCLVYKHESRHSLYWTRMVRVHREICVPCHCLLVHSTIAVTDAVTHFQLAKGQTAMHTIPIQYHVCLNFNLQYIYLHSYNQYLQLFYFFKSFRRAW